MLAATAHSREELPRPVEIGTVALGPLRTFAARTCRSRCTAGRPRWPGLVHANGLDGATPHATAAIATPRFIGEYDRPADGCKSS